MVDFLIVLLIGGVIGGIAGKVMRAGGFGVVGNIFLGMLVAWAGSHLPEWLELEVQTQDITLLAAAVSTAVVLFILGFFTKAL